MTEKSKGVVHHSIFPFIDYDRVVPDVLHLILRVSEKQLQATIREHQDDPDGTEKMRALLASIHGNQQYETIKKGEVLRPRLTGGLVNAILKERHNICFPKKNERPESVEKKRQIWDLLFKIKSGLEKRGKLTDEKIAELIGQISEWGRLYVSRFGAASFPNSAHVLVCHVPDYLKEHKDLAKFSQQGFEKIIGELKSYSRACQSPLQDIPKDLIEENNRRVLFLETEYEMTKIKDVCSWCKVPGHRVSNKNCPRHEEYLEARKKRRIE